MNNGPPWRRANVRNNGHTNIHHSDTFTHTTACAPKCHLLRSMCCVRTRCAQWEMSVRPMCNVINVIDDVKCNKWSPSGRVSILAPSMYIYIICLIVWKPIVVHPPPPSIALSAQGKLITHIFLHIFITRIGKFNYNLLCECQRTRSISPLFDWHAHLFSSPTFRYILNIVY